jgi:hypothetical protein
VLKDSAVISLSLLLNLENVDVVRELLDFLSRDRIDEGGLANTVPTDEAVLPALHELQLGLVEQGLAANDQCQVVD